MKGWSNICPETLDKYIPEDGIEALWRCWLDPWRAGRRGSVRCNAQCCCQPTLDTDSGVLWSKAWSYFFVFSGAAQGENPFLVKVTVDHIYSNLPEAASGDFGHTAEWQKMFPSSEVESHCCCGSPSRDGACWNQKLHMDGRDGCWPESLISKLLITNCYYSLVNMLSKFFPLKKNYFFHSEIQSL